MTGRAWSFTLTQNFHAAFAQGTPEQRSLVAQILRAKDMYEILGIQKDATDDDIKKAYKKVSCVWTKWRVSVCELPVVWPPHKRLELGLGPTV